jgi:hypothetical protein
MMDALWNIDYDKGYELAAVHTGSHVESKKKGESYF